MIVTITTPEPTDDLVVEVPAEGAAADESPEGGATVVADPEPDEVVISIGEPAPPAEDESKAPEWVRELRKKHREEVRLRKELEDRIKTLTAEPKPTVLAVKPTLAGSDYDEEAFAAALDQWHESKRQVDEQERASKEALTKADAEWQAKLDSYTKAKSELKVKDFAEAEAEAKTTFSTTQQGIIIQGSENSALMVYALGKNPEQAHKLATIQDPVKFAFAVAKLEVQLKITKKSSPPPPESAVVSTGRTGGTVDSALDRLRNEAEKTGDYTKVTKYKAQLKAKANQ